MITFQVEIAKYCDHGDYSICKGADKANAARR